MIISKHALTAFLLALSFALAAADCLAQAWQQAANPLMTPWAKDVSPQNVWPEYPRPQMVRDKWVNLNGLWEYAIAPKAAEQPESWQGGLLVPFPIESALSGVKKGVTPE